MGCNSSKVSSLPSGPRSGPDSLGPRPVVSTTPPQRRPTPTTTATCGPIPQYNERKSRFKEIFDPEEECHIAAEPHRDPRVKPPRPTVKPQKPAQAQGPRGRTYDHRDSIDAGILRDFAHLAPLITSHHPAADTAGRYPRQPPGRPGLNVQIPPIPQTQPHTGTHTAKGTYHLFPNDDSYHAGHHLAGKDDAAERKRYDKGRVAVAQPRPVTKMPAGSSWEHVEHAGGARNGGGGPRRVGGRTAVA